MWMKLKMLLPPAALSACRHSTSTKMEKRLILFPELLSKP
uniref:Uncharacterized protein n=1 Tax=Anguilla anguilla TaxID=7936 RepID=A0A0E9T5B4_ANGAN